MVYFPSGEWLLMEKGPTGACAGACAIHKHPRKRRDSEVIKSTHNNECSRRTIQCIYIESNALREKK